MELRVVVGPSGSGKRTRLSILQDLFGFKTLTGVNPKNLPALVHSVCTVEGQGVKLAIDVPAIPFGAGDAPSRHESYVDDCIVAFRKLKDTLRECDFKIIFQYCQQPEILQRLALGTHPLLHTTGDLPAAIFNECQLQVELFARLSAEYDTGRLARHEIVFSDRTGKSAEQLKEEISQRRYLRNAQEPDASGARISRLEEHKLIAKRVTETTEDIRKSLRDDHAFVTRGWNQMQTTVLAIATAKELIQSDATVKLNCLLLGESGTGKEGIAAYLHQCRKYDSSTFVPVDCTAFPEGLLETELFGSKEGAFTGAVNRDGLLQEAMNGTVFLDEIALMSISLQAKLLRFIETRTFRKVGSNVPITVGNCRVVAATSRNLDQAVRDGTFLVDLYNRLRAVTITLPPLRERREDILPLLARFAPDVDFKPGAQALLFDYHWEGNVRELRQVAERHQIRALEWKKEHPGQQLEVGISTLLEDWPQSVARTYLDAARRSRWSMHELNRESRTRIYFEVMEERKRAGQLDDGLKNVDAGQGENVSVILSADEIYARRLRERLNATSFNDDEIALYAAIQQSKMKDGSFFDEEDAAVEQAVKAVHQKNGGNVSNTASQMKIDRSKVNRVLSNQQGHDSPGGLPPKP